jgi:hypothetical protein
MIWGISIFGQRQAPTARDVTDDDDGEPGGAARFLL